MNILSLGYVGVTSTDLDSWRAFGRKLLALDPTPATSHSRHRVDYQLDSKHSRFMIDACSVDGGAFYGLEVAGPLELLEAASQLDRANVRVAAASSLELERRGVAGMVYFIDPAGNRLEIFHGLRDAASPFVSARPVSGFRTAEQGIGHAVFMVRDIASVLPFYTDVLGFGLSDFALAPFKAYFLHTKIDAARHHSIALVETGRVGVHHLMLETLSLDDVGQAYDLALQEDGMIGATLGRHTNDFVTSFYAWSPSKFMMEVGFGGRSVSQPWEAAELVHGPSIWGHDRTWLDEAGRAHARELRIAAARAGVRAPLQIPEGSFETFRYGTPR
ncbi:VOC family protein [Paraburkholderia sp. D15]|uniref:VOC family protein n=1 Tax=Paraburkholderia sp. D15 TaxID=2880218 RepID=UPI00247A4BED|nr:VOC family protein [Paraburkholderia sp. D15]WGS54690.1 VOC family protein [Paraburkholderia sp. D15]